MSGRSGLHWRIGSACPHNILKFQEPEFIIFSTTAIFVKKVSIFWGDPPLGKYFLYFFPDHLEGRGFHQSMPRYFAQIKVKGSKAVRPTVWPPEGAAVEISDFFPTPPMFGGPQFFMRPLPDERKLIVDPSWMGEHGGIGHYLAKLVPFSESQKLTFCGGKSFFFAPFRYAPGSLIALIDQYSTPAFRQKKPQVSTTKNKGTSYQGKTSILPNARIFKVVRGVIICEGPGGPLAGPWVAGCVQYSAPEVLAQATI